MRRMSGVCLWLAFGWTMVFNPGCGTGVIGEADGLLEAAPPELPAGVSAGETDEDVDLSAIEGLAGMPGRSLPLPLTPLLPILQPPAPRVDLPVADLPVVGDLPVVNGPIADLVVVGGGPALDPAIDLETEDPTTNNLIKIPAPEGVLKIKFHDRYRVRLRPVDPRTPHRLRPVDLDGRGLIDPLARAILDKIQTGQWARTHTPEEEVLDELRKETEAELGHAMPDLNNYFALKLPPDLSMRDGVELLQQLVEVERVAPMRNYYLCSPDYSEYQGDFEFPDGTPSGVARPYQRYLEPAPVGVDAYFAWTLPGGNGQNVNIIDIESGYDRFHPDLPPVTEDGVIFTDEVDQRGIDHGTATLGVMVGSNNADGVLGIAYNAEPYFLSMRAFDGGSGDALEWATDYDSLIVGHLAARDSRPGDIIVLEVQVAGPKRDANNPNSDQWGLIPAEWEQDIFNAIRHATAHGMVVVEAAGNGWQNLDDDDHRFNAEAPHDPFRVNSDGTRVNDSGAIIVGAGVPEWTTFTTNGRERQDFSNYGKRVDVHAWGSKVVTLGNGFVFYDEDGNETSNGTIFDDGAGFTVREDYGGTSSASAILGGVVAAIQGAYKATGYGNGYLSSKQMRDLLIRTGTPQEGNLNEHIGPLPDMRAALLDIMWGDIELVIEPWDVYCGGWSEDIPTIYPPEFNLDSGVVPPGNEAVAVYPRFGGGVYVEGSSIFFTLNNSAPDVECSIGEPGCVTYEYTLEEFEAGLPIMIGRDELPVTIRARTGIPFCWIQDNVVSDITDLVLWE